ncbi:MAG TPA: dTDP-4-dehydrorhamnose reductase [Melioribacteraceae bacterium]|nr:dTDP-4-dehydrorhamnose reductase [Melioribacteraceae bacterium]
MSKRVLVIGSNGMLGQTLVNLCTNNNYTILAASNEETSYINNIMYIRIDISDENQVADLIINTKPEYIINTAAYTNVDKSETEKEVAESINVKGVGYLAKYANQVSSQLIHISSDYVFDGNNGPYTETDVPNPIGYYGLTKLLGEEIITQNTENYTIIRTNVLYGATKYGRPDFVKWVINSLNDKKKINIVTDQINNPTYLKDLSGAIISIIEKNITGLFNIGGKTFLSRYEFTLKIADYFGLDKELITPILTEELKQPAARPLKSGLITEKANKVFNYNPIEIDESFAEMKEELNL